MTDKPLAPLSGKLLARKGAASADGFARADAKPTPAQSSTRWRRVIFSATLAISFGILSFVVTTLMLGGTEPSSGAPERTAQGSAASFAAAIEPAAAPSAAPSTVTPKPPADDFGEPHADEITAVATAVAIRDSVPVARSPDPPRAPVVPTPEAKPAASPPPDPKRRPRDVAPAGYRVQLHALASDLAVRHEWRRLRKRYGDLFSGLELIVAPVRTDAGDKTVYRMRLGALPSRAQARGLCRKLKRRKMSCIVVR